MATTAPAPRHEEFPALGEADHGHPSDVRFIWIAILLAVLTAIEVALYYVEQEEAIPQRANVVMLLALAAIKFAVVAGTFMHLKYDHPQFKRYFIGGGILAGFCYIAVLAAFGVVPPWAWFAYGGSAILLLVVATVRNRVFDAAHGGDNDHDQGDHGRDHVEHHNAAAATH
jgi:cytochrome c oxidase subunit 4/cytochrome o ubiquinol oxidase operon protein cyoD